MTRALCALVMLAALGCEALPDETRHDAAAGRGAELGELSVGFDATTGGEVEHLDGEGVAYREGERRVSLHLVEFEPEPEPALDWHTPPNPDPRRATADWTGPLGATGIVICEPATARDWCEHMVGRVHVERAPHARS